MNTMHKVYLVLFLVAAGVLLTLALTPPRAVPPNPAVTEYVYATIKPGTPLGVLQAALGEPHEIGWGEVVRVPEADGPGYRWRIDQIADRGDGPPAGPFQGRRYVYRGTGDEQIEVLVWNDGVIALEYEIDDLEAAFDGPRDVACRAADARVGASARDWTQDPEHPKYRRYYAVRALVEQSRGAARAAPTSVGDAPETSMPAATDAAPAPIGDGPSAQPDSAPPAWTPQAAEPPVGSPKSDAAPQSSAAGWRMIRLPRSLDDRQRETTRVIRRADVELPANWQWTLQSSSPDRLLVAQHETLPQIQCVVQHDRGVLEGIALGLHETGALATHASYSDGKLHGRLLLWDDQGRPRLFADYARGKPHGLFASFADGVPVLAGEAFGGTAEPRYLVSDRIGSLGVLDVLVPANLAPADRERFAEHSAALDAMFAQIDEKDRELRAAVRDAVEELRRQTASRVTAAKRKAIEARAAQRRWQNAAALQTSLNTALRRSWYLP